MNEAFMAQLDDGTHAVYRPVSGERTLRQDIPGDLGVREVAASRVNEALGFGLVPTAAMVDGPHGPGSLQVFAVGAAPGRPAGDYPAAQRHRMAVLDYVTGNTDRHRGNYLTGPDGHVVAVDHGFCFPEGARDPLRSDFVRLGEPLDQAVADAARAVDHARLRLMLLDAGLGETAVELSVARLAEVQQASTITGESWPGEIVGTAHRGGQPTTPTTPPSAPAPGRVALFANNTGEPRRVAVFEWSDGVTVTTEDPVWGELAHVHHRDGVELTTERRLVNGAEGPAFMRALLQPFRMSYYAFQAIA